MEHSEKTFVTHEKRMFTGALLDNALNKVATDWANLAHAIRQEDAYANHVTNEQKDKALQDMLRQAESIRRGEISSFTIWQRVNQELTGECVPLLKS